MLNRTRKQRNSSSSLYQFQKDITILFFEMLMTIKLYHWKTHSYASHKATDELYSKLNEHIDQFIEVLLGKFGTRIDLTKQKTIRLMDVSKPDALKREIERYKHYLAHLENNKALQTKALQTMSNSDLFNIRDEILADLNQFLYLLSFH
jgi:DNA-binding ferritin-like protein